MNAFGRFVHFSVLKLTVKGDVAVFSNDVTPYKKKNIYKRKCTSMVNVVLDARLR